MDQEIEVMNTSATNSIYAEFGVSDAVISGDLSEHEQAMLQSDVRVRDGDDAIEFDPESIEDEGDDQLEEEEEQTDEEPDGNPEGDAGSTDDLPSGDDEETPETQGDLVEATEGLKAHLESAKSIIAEAKEKGLTSELEARINAEYEAGEGFSPEVYAALEELGYSKTYIDTFVAAQEAIGEKFAQSVISYAGGQKAYDKITAFMVANDEAAIDAFNSALERNDAATLKFVLDSAKEKMNKTYGKRPARQLTPSRQAAPVAPPAVQPFADRAEMIKAMSDRRYSTDAKYRHEVEQRVFVSNI